MEYKCDDYMVMAAELLRIQEYEIKRLKTKIKLIEALTGLAC
jgi:hypothetical protein